MADGEKHPIRNGIIIAVVSAIIIAGLNYFTPKLFTFILNIISFVWKHLLSKTFLPNSLLYFLIILAIPTVFNLIKYFLRSRLPLASNQANLSSYTTDNIFEMVWKWKFITDQDMPSSDLWCFCPQCSTRLVYSSPYDAHMNQTTTFRCENCNFHSRPFVGNRDNALSRVKREVERRITTGEWQNAIGRAHPNSV